jgi:hypothetical protein
MAQDVIWVVDTSSVAEVRQSIENTKKKKVFEGLSSLVNGGRVVFPKQVVGELERTADPHVPDAQYLWAKQNEVKGTEDAPSLEQVKGVLAVVPRVLDPDKDAGAEEADPTCSPLRFVYVPRARTPGL